MRSRYQVREPHQAHFITSTIVQWLPVFTTAGCCDVVVESLQFDLAVLDHGIGRPGVAVAAEADAAGVHDQLAVHFQDVGLVRVADANDIRLDALQAPVGVPELDGVAGQRAGVDRVVDVARAGEADDDEFHWTS